MDVHDAGVSEKREDTLIDDVVKSTVNYLLSKSIARSPKVVLRMCHVVQNENQKVVKYENLTQQFLKQKLSIGVSQVFHNTRSLQNTLSANL